MKNTMKKKKSGIRRIDLTRKYLCMECGCQRDPIIAKRGFLVIELFMWLMYILPGIIYSIWRRVRTQQVCSNCRTPSIVLTSSSRAMGMMALLKAYSPSTSPLSTRPNSSSSQKPVPRKPAAPPNSKPEKKDLNRILKTSNRRGLIPKGQQGIVNFKSGNNGK